MVFTAVIPHRYGKGTGSVGIPQTAVLPAKPLEETKRASLYKGNLKKIFKNKKDNN